MKRIVLITMLFAGCPLHREPVAPHADPAFDDVEWICGQLRITRWPACQRPQPTDSTEPRRNQ